MNSKVLTLLAVVGLLLLCGTAQAGISWQTMPVLGIDSYYDGDVHINNTGALPWANIPHDVDATDPAHNPDTPGPQPVSMTTFLAGQEIHTGSGVYNDSGTTYYWKSEFINLTNPALSVSYSGSFVGNGFWMTWNTPDGGGDGGGLPAQTADAHWQYVETYYSDAAMTNVLLSDTTEFDVIPEPASLIVWSVIGGIAVGGVCWRRKRKAA